MPLAKHTFNCRVAKADLCRPRWLKTLQQALIEQRLTRREINKRVGKVKRMVKWGVAEELLQPSVFHGLQAIEGPRRARSGAKEHGMSAQADSSKH